jgi:hypothetical protein
MANRNAAGTDETNVEPKDPWRNFFKHGVGLITALGGFIGALATLIAVVSGAFSGGGGSAQQGSVIPTRRPAQLRYKEAVDSGGALAFSVPQGWVVDGNSYAQAGSYTPVFRGLPKSADVGSGLTAELHTAPSEEWNNDSAFLGVSKKAATKLGLARLSIAEASLRLRDLVRDPDWTRVGCEFVGESPYGREGFIGYYRRWRNCGQVGTFFWELFAAPVDRGFVAVLQAQTQRASSLPVLNHVLRSFRVTPENL